MSDHQNPQSTAARRMALGASAAFLARAAGAGLQLLFQIVIVRTLGVEPAGRFFLVFALVSFAAAVGRLGAAALIIRSVGIAMGIGDRARAQRSYGAALLAGGAGLAVAALGVAAFGMLGADAVFGDPALRSAIVLGAVGVVPFGLVAIQGEAIKGTGRTGRGATVQSIVAPVASLAMLALMPVDRTLDSVVVVYVAGIVVSSIVAHAVWVRILRLRQPLGEMLRQVRHARSFLREARPFFVSVFFNTVFQWTPVILLGMIAGATEVSGYFAADRWASIAAMILLAINSAIGPQLASRWHQDDVHGTLRLLRTSLAAATAIAVAMTLGMALVAAPLLSLFDPELASSRGALVVLVVGQAVLLALGPLAMFLAMSGNERSLQWISAAMAIFSIAGLIVLAPRLGTLGAGIAVAGALVLNRLLVAVVAWRVLRRALARL